MHLVGFIIRIYHDEWSLECQVNKNTSHIVTSSTKNETQAVLGLNTGIHIQTEGQVNCLSHGTTHYQGKENETDETFS